MLARGPDFAALLQSGEDPALAQALRQRKGRKAARKPQLQLDQRCFLAVVAVKSGALFATQSTNLRTAGLASKFSTSIPWR